jgi:hypothetical protein
MAAIAKTVLTSSRVVKNPSALVLLHSQYAQLQQHQLQQHPLKLIQHLAPEVQSTKPEEFCNLQMRP